MAYVCRKSVLVIEGWRVAISRARGEGVSGRFAQSQSKIRFHPKAMGKSQPAADLIFPFSLSHCSGSPDAKSARM